MNDKLFLCLVEAISLKFPHHVNKVSFPLKTAAQKQIVQLREKVPGVNDDLCAFLQLLNGDGVETLFPPFRFYCVDEIPEQQGVLDGLIRDYQESYPDSPMNDGTNGYCKDENVEWIPIGDLWGGAELLVVDMSPGPLGTVGQIMIVWDDFHTSIQGKSFDHWLSRMTKRIEQAKPDDDLDLSMTCFSKSDKRR